MRRAFSVVVSLILLAVVVWVTVDRWEDVQESVDVIGFGRLVASAALLSLGVILTGECWRRWLTSIYPAVSPITAHRLFYLTQTAKYIPGSVWPFLAQAAISRRFGIPRTGIVAATGLFLMSHTVTATIAGGAWLTASLPGWLITPLIPTLVLISLLATPPGLRLTGNVLRRFTSASWWPAGGTWSTTASTAGAMIAAWGSYGLATFVLAQPFGLQAPDYLVVTGAYALGWLAGFLALPAPGGLGVREAAFVAVTAPLLGMGPALTIALMTRVLQTLADLGLGAASANVLRDVSTITEGNQRHPDGA